MIHPVIREWVRANLDSDAARSLEPLPWGFSTPTAVATLSDRTRRVIQLFPDAAAATRSRHGASLLEGAGVPVPKVLNGSSSRYGTVVVTAYIVGTPAAALIATGEAEAMARAMGRIGAVIRSRMAP